MSEIAFYQNAIAVNEKVVISTNLSLLILYYFSLVSLLYSIAKIFLLILVQNTLSFIL